MGRKKPEDTRTVVNEVNAIYHRVMVILTGPQEAAAVCMERTQSSQLLAYLPETTQAESL